MSNQIHLTACDNQVILLAITWTDSRMLANIKSGNNNSVDVTIDIESGRSLKTINLNGVDGPLQENLSVDLPPGDYQLFAIGVNWGGPQAMELTFNGQSYTAPTSPEIEGAFGTYGPIDFTVS